MRRNIARSRQCSINNFLDKFLLRDKCDRNQLYFSDQWRPPLRQAKLQPPLKPWLPGQAEMTPYMPLPHSSWARPIRDSTHPFAPLYLQKLQEARDRLSHAAKLMKNYADKHRTDVKFSTGDLVLLRTTHLAHVPQHKLALPFCGPFRVRQPLHGDVYELDLPTDWRITPRFHASRLEPFTPPLPADQPVTDEQPPEPPELYLMERILGEEQTDDGLRYLVKWMGYDETTWEPAAHVLEADGADLIAEFHHRYSSQNPEDPYDHLEGRDVSDKELPLLDQPLRLADEAGNPSGGKLLRRSRANPIFCRRLAEANPTIP